MLLIYVMNIIVPNGFTHYSESSVEEGLKSTGIAIPSQQVVYLNPSNNYYYQNQYQGSWDSQNIVYPQVLVVVDYETFK